MFMNIRIDKIKALLILIIVLAAILRVYKISEVPPSLSWDETAVGYNAWTIANFGRDEWGQFFPTTFTSFRDDKHPVHIYATAASVKLLGLSEFSTRLPSAIFGVLSVILIYHLGKLLFKNTWLGIIAAAVLTVSPMSLHFSRFNHEFNFAMVFLMLGLVLFYQGLEKKDWRLSLAFLSFGMSLLTYHSAKVVVPPLVLLLLVLYVKKLAEMRKQLLIGLALLGLVVLVVVVNPALLGTARIAQTSFSQEEARRTWVYQQTHNDNLGRLGFVAEKYLAHFNPQYLFVSGDSNPRLSSQVTGEFYKIDALFLVVGLLALLWQRSKVTLVLLAWALLGPLPASFSAESPHAARAVYMAGSWHLIIALGFYNLVKIIRPVNLKPVVVALLLVVISWQFKDYLVGYYGEYAKRYAIDWQYGMKQIVEYVKDHPEYSQVYMTTDRSQPYIFFLYYLRIPPGKLLETVRYTEGPTSSYNTVAAFDKYYFGGWEWVDSFPTPNVLYVVTPSQFDGLRHQSLFVNTQVVKFPKGDPAFYLVSVN